MLNGKQVSTCSTTDLPLVKKSQPQMEWSYANFKSILCVYACMYGCVYVCVWQGQQILLIEIISLHFCEHQIITSNQISNSWTHFRRQWIHNHRHLLTSKIGISITGALLTLPISKNNSLHCTLKPTILHCSTMEPKYHKSHLPNGPFAALKGTGWHCLSNHQLNGISI